MLWNREKLGVVLDEGVEVLKQDRWANELLRPADSPLRDHEHLVVVAPGELDGLREVLRVRGDVTHPGLQPGDPWPLLVGAPDSDEQRPGEQDPVGPLEARPVVAVHVKEVPEVHLLCDAYALR